MGKIKLNLTSGGIVEKPLITAFKGTNSNYVVLDNEMNGSMGLPIILVCKYDNGKLVKIMDQNEWGMVKENLKSIIAGGNIEYIKVDNEVPADDVFYTQLTLPVPSYDTLKNTYKVEDETIGAIGGATASIFDVNPFANNLETNVNNVDNNVNQNTVSNQVNVEPNPMEVNNMPSNNEIVNNTSTGINTPSASNVSVANPTVENGTPLQNVMPSNNINNDIENNITTPNFQTGEPSPMANMNTSIPNTNPVIDFGSQIAGFNQESTNNVNNTNNINSTVNEVSPKEVTPISPVVNDEATKVSVTPSNEVPVTPVNNEINESIQTPNISSSIGITNDLFKEQKEAFMQACENMFDALVQRFEKELEKR